MGWYGVEYSGRRPVYKFGGWSNLFSKGDFSREVRNNLAKRIWDARKQRNDPMLAPEQRAKAAERYIAYRDASLGPPKVARQGLNYTYRPPKRFSNSIRRFQ